MRTKAEAHAERIEHGGLRYTFNDRDHFIGSDELMAVEMTGYDNVELYLFADTMENERPSVADKLQAMECRPGAIPDGYRPAQCFQAVPRKDRPDRVKAKDGFIHMYRIGSHVTACGAQASAVDTWGFLRFERIIDHERSCQKCRIEWLGHWAKRKRNEDRARYRSTAKERKKTEPQYVKVMKWTKKEKAALKAFRAHGSWTSGQGKRVPERGSATDHRTLR